MSEISDELREAQEEIDLWEATKHERLILREDPAHGWRQYVDDRPVSCGEMLLLRMADYDQDDRLVEEWVRVRYEVAWNGGERTAMWHAPAPYRDFRTPASKWDRCRWPDR